MKEAETEKLQNETLKIFNTHEQYITDANRAKYNYLKGRLLKITL